MRTRWSVFPKHYYYPYYCIDNKFLVKERVVTLFCFALLRFPPNYQVHSRKPHFGRMTASLTVAFKHFWSWSTVRDKIYLTILSLKRLKISIYFLLLLLFTALALCCCTRAFSSWGEQGLLFVAVRGLSHCGSFSCCRAQALGAQASVVVVRGLSSCGSLALERRLSSCGARV